MGRGRGGIKKARKNMDGRQVVWGLGKGEERAGESRRLKETQASRTALRDEDRGPQWVIPSRRGSRLAVTGRKKRRSTFEGGERGVSLTPGNAKSLLPTPSSRISSQHPKMARESLEGLSEGGTR